MTDRQPHTGEQKPDDIADQAQRPRPEVLSPGQILAAHCLLAEGPEGELADDETGLAPRNSDDGNKRQQADQPPAEPHQNAAHDEPQQVSECAHGLSFPV